MHEKTRILGELTTSNFKVMPTGHNRDADEGRPAQRAFALLAAIARKPRAEARRPLATDWLGSPVLGFAFFKPRPEKPQLFEKRGALRLVEPHPRIEVNHLFVDQMSLPLERA